MNIRKISYLIFIVPYYNLILLYFLKYAPFIFIVNIKDDV